MDSKIAIIIVLFHPNDDDISHIESLSKQYQGVVIDNSSNRCFKDNNIGLLHYIFNNGNKGIAEAQNIGIDFLLKENKYECFVFLDQDSRVKVDYVKKIVEEYKIIKTIHPNLAMLGPSAINERSNKEYKSIFHSGKIEQGVFILQREIISSGSCVGVDVISKVGGLISWMFIDYVDFEWCWRANSMGYICGITPNVSIQHCVGKKEYYIGNYIIIISSPIRYFYQGRNYIKLLKYSYVPFQWKCTTMIKSCLRLIYLPFVPGGGIQCWKQFVRGLISGFFKYDHNSNSCSI